MWRAVTQIHGLSTTTAFTLTDKEFKLGILANRWVRTIFVMQHPHLSRVYTKVRDV